MEDRPPLRAASGGTDGGDRSPRKRTNPTHGPRSTANRINLFEYTIQRVVEHRLGPVFQDRKYPAVRFVVMQDLQAECSQLLSVLAWQGGKDRATAEKAYNTGNRSRCEKGFLSSPGRNAF